MINLYSEINSSNIANLRPDWSYQTVSYVTGQPLLWNDKVICYDWGGYLYSLNSSTGKLNYKVQLYQPAIAKKILKKIPVLNKYIGEPLPYLWNGFAGSGCINDDKLYLASVGSKPGKALTNGESGKFYIVNLENGSTISKDRMAIQNYSGSISDIIEYKGTVYVGLSSVDEVAATLYKLLLKSFRPQSVGAVIAYSGDTGKRIWKTSTIGLVPDDIKYAKGAGVWGGFAIDPDEKSIYFGTGNNYGTPASKTSDSVVSLDSQTGELKWKYQAVADDSWLPTKPKDGPDFDFGAAPILFDIKRNNKILKVLGLGNKNGYFYVLNRTDGSLVWKTNCNVNSTSEDGIRSKASYYNGRIFIWSKNKTPRNTLTVCCLNADTGDVIWSYIAPGTNTMSDGLLLNDLYIVPYYNGTIQALSISDGKVLWTGKIPGVSFGSSISVYGNRLFVGGGLPGLYGGNSKNYGLYTFSLQ